MQDSKKPMDSRDKNSGFDTVVAFCRKNVRYISAGVVFLLLVLLLVKVNGENNKTGQTTQADSSKEVISVTSTQEQEETQSEESDGYEVNAYPEVNKLIQSYYKAYAKGDLDAIKKCAEPISDTEKSYLKVFSKYVEEYKNIVCYTKPGLEGKDAYMVSAYYDMKLKGAKTMAPGLDFFYVEKTEDDAWTINNIYSQYNIQNKEYEMEEDMIKLMSEFENDEDVVELKKEVQDKYIKALESDEDLNKIITVKLQKALANWADEVVAEQKSETEKKDAKAEEEKEQKEKEQKEKEEKEQKEKEQKEKEEKEQKEKEQKEKEEKEQKEKEQKEKEEKEQKEKEQKEKEKKEKSEKNTKSEILYTTSKVNIRKKPDQNSDKIGEVEIGTKVKVLETTDSGWSKVEYQGQEAYIKSEFLSKDKPADKASATFLETGKTIRLTQSIVIRNGIGEDKGKLGTAFSGETVTVIMSYEEGWTKVSWKGVEGYAKTDVIK
ncbi:MAG: SH3 domain-containing protein [Lachnospiraceae bacterium]